MQFKTVRFVDDGTGKMLEEIAKEDLRTQANMVAFLIHKEYEARQAKKRPQFPAVTTYPPVIVPLDPDTGQPVSGVMNS